MLFIEMNPNGYGLKKVGKGFDVVVLENKFMLNEKQALDLSSMLMTLAQADGLTGKTVKTVNLASRLFEAGKMMKAARQATL
ncbi:MAG: hypothetical protein M0036_19120 [Desulfobacteraceae bacterium]|nr:hypothetical protein [Desulfobacteraceae bacterium]